VGADQERARARGVGVQSLDEFIQAICDAIVELRNALAFGRRNNNRLPLWGEVFREVLRKDFVRRR
jgi:hypothetical protein